MQLSSKKLLHTVNLGNDGLRNISDAEKEKLHEVLTSMLIDIKEACSKVGVEFVLCGGSCLGAVRHKGFIPWDDDVDISMFRDDWEKFKLQFNHLLGERYILEAPNYNNQDSKYPWPKIYQKGSEYVDMFDVDYPYEHGISIDIFVIEDVSENKFVRKIDSLMAAFFKFSSTSILFYKYPSPYVKKAFSMTFESKLYFTLRRGLGMFCSIVSHKKMLMWYDQYISRHHGNSDMVTIPTGTKLYSGEMLPRNVWLPYTKGTFCGYEMNLPNNYDFYLRNLYGDNYMQLPPEEKRETHSIVKLKFPE